MTLVFAVLGWSGKAWAVYPNAPTISTIGSADYSSIATNINNWKNAWSPDRGAYNNRSTIIDNVEATLKAAGKASITDGEYDALADALYWWLHQVVVEGYAAGDNRGGWYISGIGIPEWYFSDGSTLNCVWELTNAAVPIAGGGQNGYGPMLGDNVRMVLITNLTESTIVRGSELCNVMFSTNGVNSKLLVMGRKNHKIAFKGDVNWSDPSSYSEVLNRSVASGQRGQLVTVNSGSLMTAYTTFHNNVTNTAKCSYKIYYNYDPPTPAAAPDGITISYSYGGAIGVRNKMNCCSFYYTDIKNNATSENDKFGGGIGFTNIAAKTAGTDGNVYFNHCTIKGNRNNSHGGGVALYINDAADGRNVYFTDTELSYNCQASVLEAHGGGLWVVNKYDNDPTKQRKVYFDGCTFTGNYACGKTAAGGAISNEGTIILENSAFNNNVAANSFGGAIYNRPQMAAGATKGVDLTVSGCSFTGNQCTWTGDLSIDANDPNSNPTRGCGGAIMIDVFRSSSYDVAENYVVKLDIENNCTFTNNHADRNGGAIAVAACRDMESWMDNPPAGHGTLTSNMEIKSATMSGNTADKSVTWPSGRGNYGGAVYLSYTNLNVTGNNGNIQVKNNGNVNSHTATHYGGAVAIYKGNLSLSGGTFGASGNGNKATYGGAFYINQGTVSLGRGNISYNTATEQGGGLYTTGNGSISVSGVTISSNTAKAGGGLYTNNSSATNFNMTNGTISGNSATSGNGGGVCLNDMTTLKLSTGTITSNTASANGGGVYLGANGALELSGAGTITGNSVTSGLGGGVYMGGAMSADGTSLNVSGNTKAGVVNNVYLPHNKTITVGSSISPNVTLGIYTERTYEENNNTHIPVLYSTNTTRLNEIYSAMTNGQSNIRDDRGIHKAEYTSADVNRIYFTKVQFDYPAYTSDFSNPIDSKAKLYQFMCWVNGLNGYGETHPGAEGIVTADISMSGIQYWYPIGEHNVVSPATPYTGNFDANGHVIKDLSFNDGLIEDWGLFGTIASGATLTDVFVQNMTFATKTTQGSIGSLVGKMTGGTVKGCGARGTLSTSHANCAVGGMVGKLESGTIHSSFAMSDMTGYQMGGLVGEISLGGALYNSFANGKFHSSGTGYVGGLVGVNTGVIENCYAREQSGSSHGSTFGYLAGANQMTVSGTTTKGNINYSYAPNTPYTASGVGGNQTGVSTYTATSTPYLYMHADNQIATVSGNSYIENGPVGTVVGGNEIALKGLLATLNNWVTLNGSTTYTKWMRTTASPINDDYPIHKYSDYVCVGSIDNVGLEYHANFNTKFGEYITANSGTVYLYNTPAALSTGYNVTVSNKGKNTKLFIGEHVALQPQNATDAYDIIATVGVSLDNSAGAYGAHPSQGGADVIDWHMFSTSLEAAPLGVNYNGDAQEWPFSWGAPPTGMPAYQFYAEGNANHGYFPSKVYGTNADYYDDWDYYAYFEPEYHWINFKRNGNSHWHEDYTTVKINYKSNGTGADWTNETNLINGRGYLVATKEPTFLQCSGTLAKGTISVDVTSGAWRRKGYNLLGNPYQSYLDFQKFAEKNKALWGITGTDYSAANYFILDEDQQGYIKYAYGASANTYTAPMYLHPHQGFMVIAESGMTVEFNEAMRNTTATGVTFRDGESAQPAYPLVNLIATEANGNRDICTVELGRPDKGGAPVQRAMRICNGLIYCHYDDADWGIAFTQPGVSELPIRFETAENTQFVLTWDTQNGDFSYMHLIDNMTGTDIDCLVTDEYKFTASTNDYASRFRLVFDYTGVEENGDDINENDNFAFQMGDELVVNGEGTLQLFDMTGRLMMETRVSGTQSTVAMPAASQGIYLLRLTTRNATKTQKIVLR